MCCHINDVFRRKQNLGAKGQTVHLINTLLLMEMRVQIEGGNLLEEKHLNLGDELG